MGITTNLRAIRKYSLVLIALLVACSKSDTADEQRSQVQESEGAYQEQVKNQQRYCNMFYISIFLLKGVMLPDVRPYVRSFYIKARQYLASHKLCYYSD